MALDGVDDEGHTPAALTQRKGPGIYFTEDWEGLMAGLNKYGKKSFAITGVRTSRF